jgi:hypothetical protein
LKVEARGSEAYEAASRVALGGEKFVDAFFGVVERLVEMVRV